MDIQLTKVIPTPPHACGNSACTAPARVQWQRHHPDEPGSTQAVYACAGHGIGPDVAARVHQPDCPGPDSPRLPECGCAPEPLPPQEPDLAPPDLPAGWAPNPST